MGDRAGAVEGRFQLPERAAARRLEGLCIEARVEFFFGQQGDGAIERRRRRLHPELESPAELRVEIVLRALKRPAIPKLRTVREHVVEDDRNAFLARRLLHGSARVHAAVSENGVGDLRGAHDQRDSVAELRARGRSLGRRRKGDVIDERIPPGRQLRRCALDVQRLFRPPWRGRRRRALRGVCRRRQSSDDRVIDI